VKAADGSVLRAENRVAFDHPTSSGRVFDPNPVVTAGAANIPGSPLLADCDSPTAAEEARLSSEYRTYTLQGINAGQNKLKGAYADLTAPGIFGAYKAAGQADEPTHVYSYDCDDDRFEEVMVYYHVDRAQRAIQSLGFTGGASIVAFPIAVHAHYYANCNAYFSAADFGLHFGDGCTSPPLPVVVDTAEDADIIVHEYGHAVHWDAAGGWPDSPEPRAIAEGFADFFAAVLNGGPCLFEWGAAVGYPNLLCGRRVDDGQYFDKDTVNVSYHRYYPEDIHPNEHATGLIWATALWDMTVALGDDQVAREKVLKLALEGMQFTSFGSGFAGYAAGLRQADIALFAGADLSVIEESFKDHGICWSAGTCISGMHSVNYTTMASPVNACTVLVRQNGNGSGANGIEGDISCTTARDGVIVSGNLDQTGSPTIVALDSQFADPPVTVHSSGPIVTNGSSGGPGTWNCTAGCIGNGTWTSTRFRRTASSFMYAATGGSLPTVLGDTLTVPAGSAATNATFVI
jgi:hypothetical protein